MRGGIEVLRVGKWLRLNAAGERPAKPVRSNALFDDILYLLQSWSGSIEMVSSTKFACTTSVMRSRVAAGAWAETVPVTMPIRKRTSPM
jgi:hypothetical protein